MLNCEVARKTLINITDPYASNEEIQLVHSFIDAVEHLLKHNSIKQTPALFKPYEDKS